MQIVGSVKWKKNIDEKVLALLLEWYSIAFDDRYHDLEKLSETAEIAGLVNVGVENI